MCAKINKKRSLLIFFKLKHYIIFKVFLQSLSMKAKKTYQQILFLIVYWSTIYKNGMFGFLCVLDNKFFEIFKLSKSEVTQNHGEVNLIKDKAY